MRNQHHSTHQKGIIKRYYENKDTIMYHKLSELVSELYLCENPEKAERIWKRVERALLNMEVEKTLIQHLMEDRSVEALAEVIAELA